MTASGATAADDKQDCGAAFSAAPDLTKAGRLLDARAALVKCASEVCPTNMRPLCADDLRHLEPQIPTIVLVAKTGKGQDVLDVRVTEDARPLVDRIDGRAVSLDPGSHRFRFERTNGLAVEVAAMLHEGEKGRTVTAVFPDEASTQQPLRTDERTGRPIPWTVYVAAGVAVVATAGFATFGLRGISERSDLSSCQGTCTHDQVQQVRDSYLVANVSLGAAVVAAGIAVVLFLTRH
jgi:hypothetical protein